MKTEKLIRLLQEEDPSGEMDVTIGNQDIRCLQLEPSYWDGCKQILTVTKDKENYNVESVEVTSAGHKLVIVTFSIRSAIWTSVCHDIPFDIKYDDYSKETYKKTHDKWRQEAEEYVAERDS